MIAKAGQAKPEIKIEIKKTGSKRPNNTTNGLAQNESKLPITAADWQLFENAKQKFMECLVQNDWKHIPRLN